MDERPWVNEENLQIDCIESLTRDEDENLESEKEEALQADWERLENRKTVRRVFGRIAQGLSAMMIAIYILSAMVHAVLDSIFGGVKDINVLLLLSSLVLYSAGIVTYLVLNRWVPNAPAHKTLLSPAESFDNEMQALAEPFDEEMLSPTETFGDEMQPEQWANHKTGSSRPRKLTLWVGSKLVVICLALGFVFNLITMGISFGINFFNHAREVRELTQQYLETGYGVIPEPPSFLEADPLLEVLGGLNPVLAFLLVVVTTSIFEEMIFRKLLYDKLIVFGGKVFIVVSSLLFALFHLNYRQLLYTFVVGLIFAGVMYYTQKVSYCILLHMAFNAFGIMSMYVQEMSEMIMEIYGRIYLGLVMIGVVFLIIGIVFAKRWATFDPAQIEVKKRRDIFFNPGMIIFIILTIVGMIGNALYFSA